MSYEDNILDCLRKLLEEHEGNGTLLEKTPRKLRAEVADIFRIPAHDVEMFKDRIKVEINGFISVLNAKDDGELEQENRVDKNGRKGAEGRSRKKRKDRAKTVPASSDDSSAEVSCDDDCRPASPSSMRSMAKMLGVPPSFWQGLDKNDATQIRGRLLEFCASRNISRQNLRELPTRREAQIYKRDRDRRNELEGIQSTNIITGKRKRFTDLLF
jgi:hypothetical protein